jgi:hypothetical protein
MRRYCVLIIALCLAACEAALATPTPDATRELFKDDFSQDRSLWEMFEEPTGNAYIADGSMIISASSPWSVSFSVAAINLADFDLSVNAARQNGEAENSYGIIFRYIDEENFYRLDFTGDGLWGVSRRRGDQWISILELQSSPAIRTEPGAANNLRIVGKAKDFTFYANGIQLGMITDNNLPVGRIGLFASTFAGTLIEASFDDIKVVIP